MSPCHTRPTPTTSTRPATTASATRRAIRPTSRRPTVSWAEPGSTSVISSRVTARRNRTRAAASTALSSAGRPDRVTAVLPDLPDLLPGLLPGLLPERLPGAPTPGEVTGGMREPFECWLRGVQYHQPHQPHAAAARRTGGPTWLSRGLT